MNSRMFHFVLLTFLVFILFLFSWKPHIAHSWGVGKIEEAETFVIQFE